MAIIMEPEDLLRCDIYITVNEWRNQKEHLKDELERDVACIDRIETLLERVRLNERCLGAMLLNALDDCEIELTIRNKGTENSLSFLLDAEAVQAHRKE